MVFVVLLVGEESETFELFTVQAYVKPGVPPGRAAPVSVTCSPTNMLEDAGGVIDTEVTSAKAMPGTPVITSVRTSMVSKAAVLVKSVFFILCLLLNHRSMGFG